MSKRQRRQREDVRPADHSGRASHQLDEPKLVVPSQAFAELDAWLDEQLEMLVNRWSQVAAPAATSSRRIVPQESPRPSGQA